MYFSFRHPCPIRRISRSTLLLRAMISEFIWLILLVTFTVLISNRKDILSMRRTRSPPSPPASLTEKVPFISTNPLKATSRPTLDRPRTSQAAILHSKQGPYTHVPDHPIPELPADRILIRVHAIGLNPIDWKCVTYGFGIHSLPWLSGREAAGTVEEVGSEASTSFKRGDRVWIASTNYRDNSTSTFQQVCLTSS